ncbi:MAG TPA: hypothetical protein VL652_24530 [Kutzneria sp.]|jgi:hypothetical protein|nr:hypothetical protein [Kutzneria sp.]
MEFIAVIIALASLVAAVGYDGYLFMLGSAASRRAGGESIAQWVRSRWPQAGITTVAALLALLIASGGLFLEIIAIVVAVGAGGTALRGLQDARKQLNSGSNS